MEGRVPSIPTNVIPYSSPGYKPKKMNMQANLHHNARFPFPFVTWMAGHGCLGESERQGDLNASSGCTTVYRKTGNSRWSPLHERWCGSRQRCNHWLCLTAFCAEVSVFLRGATSEDSSLKTLLLIPPLRNHDHERNHTWNQEVAFGNEYHSLLVRPTGCNYYRN